MSKAEERAKERYWLEPSNIDTQNKYQAYLEGYHQAEKDLALTWRDMKLIWNITDEMDDMPEEEFYKEVLNRFNKQKEDGKVQNRT